ncbi:hypothetical protein DOO78_22410 [Roseicella frigidaeris]|uniref:Uncharacterized protein n=1 Tax=Roseicella frigidaeris TaxID=2230885 RepID=A0A327LYV3_9PROT|nr:hypothetical protein DOO78_22410 [Roseicella frigidaeris]
MLLPVAAAAQPHPDPDWPCVQRYVPEIGAAALWPEAPGGDWQDDPGVAALVGRIAPRPVEAEQGLAAIRDFAAPLDAAARRRLLPLAFRGVLEETNRQRDAVIDQIRRYARRQHDLAGRVRELEAALRAAPPPAREELEQRRFFAAKTYADAERMLRYACEVPVRLEGRLGAYARAMQAAMPQG